MNLHLITADAREVIADVQFVKHFNGLFGGAEAALDWSLTGKLETAVFALESNRFLTSEIVQSSPVNFIGSRNLLVLSLGDIRRFTLGDLEGAISHATRESLKKGFKIIATPVIGISDHVGLPIERAYRTVLQSIISTTLEYVAETATRPSITDVTIFDFDDEKVNYFIEITPDILSQSRVNFERRAVNQFNVQVETATRSAGIITSGNQSYISSFHTQEVNAGGKIIKSDIVKVLYLAANPNDTKPLRLDEEIREIDTAFRQSEYRNFFDIRQHWAVRVIDLQSHLLRHNPNIVHFSGHGSAASCILLEDITGKSQPVSPRALSQLFCALKDNIKCVVLNACYSEGQANAIAEHIDCVVGMSSVIGDRAAISFATAFYQALGYGKDIKTAFELGCVQIDIEGLNEKDTPKLISKRVNPGSIFFTPDRSPRDGV